MHRLLVLSGLATAIVTFPAFAGTGPTIPSGTAIGSAIAGHDIQRAGDDWTPARMAAATQLTLLVRRGSGKAVRQS